MTSAPTLILANAKLPDGRLADVTVAGERIGAIDHISEGNANVPSGRPSPLAQTGRGDLQVLDCRGSLLIPSFVEGHIHLDKTSLGLPFIPHRPGATVAERISNEKQLRKTLPLSIEERGGLLTRQVARFGTGALRTHVDIDTDVGLRGLEAVLRIKEAHRHLVDMEIVAFPQSGILRDPGTADLLAAALQAGADLVGGLDPAGIDGDIAAHLDCVFGLAEHASAGIDIHLHDPGPLGAFELRNIAARTRAAGLQGRVAVSHAYALGAIDDGDFGRTGEALAAAQVAIMTNAPGVGPMPPVKRLHTAGVTVFAGSDNIRDTWWPYGDGDMLDRACVIGYRQGFYTNEDLEHGFAMVTGITARVLGIHEHQLQIGHPADLVLLSARSIPEAVLDRPRGRTVIKRGRIVVRDGDLVA